MSRDDALYVAEHMRRSDRREIFACRWNDSISDLADDCACCRPLAWTAKDGDEPVAVFGVSQVRPGVVQAWFFATSRFPTVAKSVTAHVKRVIHPALRESGVHRIEAHSIEGHTEAHRWMERCFGAIKEADHPGFGRRAETFHTFAWTSLDVRTENPERQ